MDVDSVDVNTNESDLSPNEFPMESVLQNIQQDIIEKNVQTTGVLKSYLNPNEYHGTPTNLGDQFSSPSPTVTYQYSEQHSDYNGQDGSITPNYYG